LIKLNFDIGLMLSVYGGDGYDLNCFILSGVRAGNCDKTINVQIYKKQITTTCSG